MMNTYCGKDCEQCAYKAKLNCPGCKVGPGKPIGGDCDLASCCRDKNYESCSACSNRDSCIKLKGCASIPEYRFKMGAPEESSTKLSSAEFLHNKIQIVFVLAVILFVSEIVFSDVITEVVPVWGVFGSLIGLVCDIVYGIIFFVLAAENDRFKKAGICYFLSMAVGILAVIALLLIDNEGILILLIPAIILVFVSEYNEFMGFSEVLYGYNTILSDKWENLWKWYIGAILAIFGCGLVAVISTVLGILCLFACAIVIFVVEILKLVYLKQTVVTFRDFVNRNSYSE